MVICKSCGAVVDEVVGKCERCGWEAFEKEPGTSESVAQTGGVERVVGAASPTLPRVGHVSGDVEIQQGDKLHLTKFGVVKVERGVEATFKCVRCEKEAKPSLCADCHESSYYHLADVGRQRDEARKEANDLSGQYDILAERLRILVSRNLRLSRLLRSTLPKGRQFGCGVEGMVESLLAWCARLSRYDGEPLDADFLKAAQEYTDAKAELRRRRRSCRPCKVADSDTEPCRFNDLPFDEWCDACKTWENYSTEIRTKLHRKAESALKKMLRARDAETAGR